MNPNELTHRSALELLAEGIKPVRLVPRDKKALEPGWPRRIHDEVSVREEFQHGENVGALVGEPSGWVVDVDIDSMKALALASEFLPPTRTFGRKSKRGSHRLYRVRGAATRVWADEHGAHIVNLRSTGNQTMMPNSTHPSGELVEWENELPIVEMEAHELTAKLDALALRCGWERPQPRAERPREPVAATGAGYGATALARELEELRSTREGGRNDQLNRTAFSIGQLVRAGELPPDALDAVERVAVDIGLPPHEVESTMRSATAAAERNPRAPRVPRDEPPAVREKPRREDVQRNAHALVEELVAQLAETQGRTLGGIDIPGFHWLSDALFGLRGVCLFTGPSGAGKTTLVNNLAVNVARAGEVPVVYVTAEMTRTEVAESMVASVAPIRLRDLQTGTVGGARGTDGLSARLMLTDKERPKVERALRELDELSRTQRLAVLAARDYIRPWDRHAGEHALSGLADAVAALHPTGPVLVVLDTLATLDIRPSRGELHRTDLDADGDTVDALVAWRTALHPSSCILCIHEESKAATGTGDGHSARGSSRYLYSCTQRLNLVNADAPGGTRTLGMREGEPEDGVREVDLQVSKARRGGSAGTVVALEFLYTTGQYKELCSFTPRDMAEKASKPKGRKQ